jgi:hypothetical protein
VERALEVVRASAPSHVENQVLKGWVGAEYYDALTI